MQTRSYPRMGLLLLLAAMPVLAYEPPAPTTLEELKQAITTVLHETQTPGAGVVLVYKNKVL